LYPWLILCFRHIIVNTLHTSLTNNNYNGNNNNNKKKEAEKILKYENLIIEIQRMWNMKTKVIPVIIGATGTISKSLRQCLNNTAEKHEIKEQNNRHIGYCKHNAESSNVKVQKIFHGRKTLHVAQIVTTERLQHYVP